MPIINERYSIRTDEAIDFAFPTLDESYSQLLLIYEASSELHQIDIKDKIVEFLLKEGTVGITALVNSSIYFTIHNLTQTRFNDLNNNFQNFIKPIEEDNNGKLFWLFNQISAYRQNPLESQQRLKKLAIIGKGNSALRSNFDADVKTLKEKLED